MAFTSAGSEVPAEVAGARERLLANTIASQGVKDAISIALFYFEFASVGCKVHFFAFRAFQFTSAGSEFPAEVGGARERLLANTIASQGVKDAISIALFYFEFASVGCKVHFFAFRAFQFTSAGSEFPAEVGGARERLLANTIASLGVKDAISIALFYCEFASAGCGVHFFA